MSDGESQVGHTIFDFLSMEELNQKKTAGRLNRSICQSFVN